MNDTLKECPHCAELREAVADYLQADEASDVDAIECATANLGAIMAGKEPVYARKSPRTDMGDGPHRFHLESPVTFITTDGPQEVGPGWLLISEAEYAALRTGEATDV